MQCKCKCMEIYYLYVVGGGRYSPAPLTRRGVPVPAFPPTDQLSTVNCQMTVPNYHRPNSTVQLSSLNCQLSMTTADRSIIQAHCSTVHRSLSTDHCPPITGQCSRSHCQHTDQCLFITVTSVFLTSTDKEYWHFKFSLMLVNVYPMLIGKKL